VSNDELQDWKGFRNGKSLFIVRTGTEGSGTEQVRRGAGASCILLPDHGMKQEQEQEQEHEHDCSFSNHLILLIHSYECLNPPPPPPPSDLSRARGIQQLIFVSARTNKRNHLTRRPRVGGGGGNGREGRECFFV
jgi:hypothetical protein